MGPLPPGAKETYQREGWLLVPGLVEAAQLKALLKASEVLQQAAATFERDVVIEGVGYELQSASGRKGEPPVAPGALRKIAFPSKRQRAFQELRRDPALLATLEALGLPGPHCLVDQVNLKLPQVGTGFPFHQDARFVVGSVQGRIERKGGINLVIALDRSDAENGTFQVLGRTHTQGLIDFPYDLASMNEGVFDETHREVLTMAPGDAVFFHPHLAHGSGPNPSPRQRRIVTLWFAGT